MTLGTPSYMSPEQIVGRDIAPPCDIYSLGVIAYEALAGHLPFDPRSLAASVSSTLHSTEPPLAPQCPAAPPGLCQLIHRMLEKAGGQRPTASEVRESLRALLNEMTLPQLDLESSEPRTLVAPSAQPLPAAVVTVRLQPNTGGRELQGEIVRS